MALARPTVCSQESKRSTLADMIVVGEATPWGKQDSLRQKPQLPNHGRGPLRPVWPVRQHTPDTDW